jgi:DNA-binding NtrC family response regulator
MSAKVLIVDDEEPLRASVGKILERSGFEVALAGGVSEALEKIAAEPFDVLLSDLRMPGPGDGTTVVRAMREKNANVVTLLMSAAFEASLLEDGIALNEDELVSKPFRMKDLTNLIQRKLAAVGGEAGRGGQVGAG